MYPSGRYLTTSACILNPIARVMINADAIIIGPGSLYTNVIPNLLIKNVAKTIRESKALKIYISNIILCRTSYNKSLGADIYVF